ncbi:FMN-binding negative transcriptional regulator [Streptomyces sp. NPDC057496]|uniref:FMN-binding negative transcriptional regulator n=1 Tax=Streptomyces sp. NPDC057496 TaxID=3346149 RepID=UPI0036773ABC
MFVPPMYRTENEGRLRQVMERYPLAMLLTNGEPTPYATHLPVVFDQNGAPGTDGPVGATLLGHMNRDNPHWRTLTDGLAAKLVFTGPHSYITPTLYETTPAAPTWNFVTVHLEGTVHPVTDFEETLGVVQATVETFELAFGSKWDMDSSLDYFRHIGPAVGAFRFVVTSADGMFKLSQEKTPEIQHRIADRLIGTETGTRHELGALMAEFTLGDRDGV